MHERVKNSKRGFDRDRAFFSNCNNEKEGVQSPIYIQKIRAHFYKYEKLSIYFTYLLWTHNYQILHSTYDNDTRLAQTLSAPLEIIANRSIGNSSSLHWKLHVLISNHAIWNSHTVQCHKVGAKKEPFVRRPWDHGRATLLSILFYG